LTHKEEPGFGENREEDTSIAGMPPFLTRPIREEDYSDEESEGEDEYLLGEEVESPQTWMYLLNGRLLISEMEENCVKHGWMNSGLLLRVGMTRIVL
jgi:hypothetical protein